MEKSPLVKRVAKAKRRSPARPQESALQFIQRYLREQNRFLQRYSSCYELRKQSVLEITGTRSDTTVTTSGMGPRQRRRYRLRRLDGTWKLIAIKLECGLCAGLGNVAPGMPCGLCRGAGWTVA
jgi:hypothetical protein